MAKQKVLVQDIADALNLSRTTVSKALNNSGSVSKKTRDRVFQKAAELNYKYFSFLQPSDDTKTDSASLLFQEDTDTKKETVLKQSQIAVFFSKNIDKQHIGFNLLSVLGQELSQKNYTISLFFIQEADLKNCHLPNTFIPEQVTAILCVELLDRTYSHMLCSLNKPVMFIDAYAGIVEDGLNADILIAENRFHLSRMIKELITRYHLQKVGFVGAYSHCLSFFERYTGFYSALLECHLNPDPSCCILSPDDLLFQDQNWLLKRLKCMDSLPELFVCANDIYAYWLIACLKELNIRVPEDVMITGFDNAPLSYMTEPSLTTIDARSAEIGNEAARLLLYRLEHPDFPPMKIHLQSTILYRNSTERKKQKKREDSEYGA